MHEDNQPIYVIDNRVCNMTKVNNILRVDEPSAPSHNPFSFHGIQKKVTPKLLQRPLICWAVCSTSEVHVQVCFFLNLDKKIKFENDFTMPIKLFNELVTAQSTCTYYCSHLSFLYKKLLRPVYSVQMYTHWSVVSLFIINFNKINLSAVFKDLSPKRLH